MKRIGLILIAFFLVTFPLYSQYVRFSDRYLAQALIEAGVDTNGDRRISYAEAEAVINLDVSDSDISDMTGIEAFVNLETLDCGSNELTSLDVSKNTALKFLNCEGYWGDGRLTSLNVSNNTVLTHLYCSGNRLTSLDLSNNTALYELDCSRNQLTSLDLSNNTALYELDCSRNQLTSLDVSNNTSLRYLDCSYMFSLYKVCVWESFPVSITYGREDSPNVYFTTECDTDTVFINKNFRFGSTGDPLNGLTIAWNSNGTADSIAWGYTPDLEHGEPLGVMSTSIIGNQFDYTFPPLTAASTIHYSIFDSNNSIGTEIKTINTASDPSNNQFSFTVLGDSRTNLDKWQIISEATLDTDFSLFLGDIVESGGDVTDWTEWFEYGEEFISRELIYHCVGNHDTGGDTSSFDYFSGLFTLPSNELYYSFTNGNAVFICLNSSYAEDTEQYNWLLSTLEANKDQTWKIVFFHKPFYSAPNKTGQMDDYLNTWWKAFDDYGVDMIFAGHAHNYQRTKPINRNISTTSPVASYGSGEGQGRCQIVSGGAGAPLKDAANPSLWWLANSASRHHFCNVDINGGVLTFVAMDANRVVFDRFVINKTTGINNFRSAISWIYPNPANDVLTLQLREPGEYSIEITSMNGQLISSTKMEGTSCQIDLSSFQKGFYLITIRSNNFVTTEKILKL